MLMFKSNPRNTLLAALALVGLLAFALTGCGSDDDDGDGGNPMQPGGTDTFDEATAVIQADAAVSQAVSLVESIDVFAGGISKSAEKDYDYGWSEANQRWEWHWEMDEEGYVYDWLYWVQYLNSDDEPLPNVLGAVRVDHAMNGTASYHYEGDGTVLDHSYDYNYQTAITGLGSDTHVMNGSGGYDYDYEGHSDGHSYAASYEIAWMIVAPGIARPATGGCPTGVIRYDFDPYYCLITFDGTDTATYVLYDGDGDMVPSGSGSHGMYCGMIETK